MLLKGQSNEIFNLLFFSSLKLVWATDQQVKIFSIFDKNSPSSTNFKFENMTPRGMIPRQVNLPGVWYPGESVFSTLKFEYLSEISTKIEIFLTHRSVTHTGSNVEKYWRSKISLDCPFKQTIT